MSVVPPSNAISVVVPVLNEEELLPNTLARLERFSPMQIILVDGGSRDGTIDLLQSWVSTGSGRMLLSAPVGRARQMNEGARRADGDILLFLHADSVLPDEGPNVMIRALKDPRVAGGAFRLKIDHPHPLLRMISWGANARSSLLKLPYGDQGLFVRKELFRALGGFADIPLMEDVDFVRRLKRCGQVVLLKQTMTTSCRRWQKNGLLKTSARNAMTLLLYFMGVSPKRLAGWYDRQSV